MPLIQRKMRRHPSQGGVVIVLRTALSLLAAFIAMGFVYTVYEMQFLVVDGTTYDAAHNGMVPPTADEKRGNEERFLPVQRRNAEAAVASAPKSAVASKSTPLPLLHIFSDEDAATNRKT
eukprot:CAMPEP_0183719162 /NCGR_PEP_ID=MMETSP0737-20130205/12230_1 /TAXON_ID=385413 /ORGANISM="Thalassiosira miniscula, Strain CCMP1093" /LENGTH=119 /DNA_ID=CAMNT_0025948869 /DNA_START=155 /DNA_END=511 /DNA_ORIENTATION=-